MSIQTKNRKRTRAICQAAIIAAAYTVLTYVTALFGLASGVIQLRLSEALCALCIFTPTAIPGLTLGCLISNLVTGCLPTDVLFGSLATLLGAAGGWLLRKRPYLAPLPTVLSNTVIVPFVLRYAYLIELPIPVMMLTVFLGEVISCGVLGLILYKALEKKKDDIFRI